VPSLEGRRDATQALRARDRPQPAQQIGDRAAASREMRHTQAVAERHHQREGDRLAGARHERTVGADGPGDVLALDPSRGASLVDQPVALAGQLPESREVAARRTSRLRVRACRREVQRESRDAREAEVTCDPLDGRVVLGGVQTRGAGTEAPRAIEAVSRQRGRDAAPAKTGIDAQPVQPGLAVTQERQLRHPGHRAVDGRDPQAAAPVADPFGERLTDVVVAPDTTDQCLDRAPVGGTRCADRDALTPVLGLSVRHRA